MGVIILPVSCGFPWLFPLGRDTRPGARHGLYCLAGEPGYCGGI